MANFTVADIVKEARQVYLVDTDTGEIFTDTVLIPFVMRAFDELNLKLARVGHQASEKVSAALPLAALAITLAPPVDMLEPISLEERAAGSVSEDDWREMTRETILHSASPQVTLGNWDWANNLFNFRGATGGREVKIRYLRFVETAGLTISTAIQLNCKSYVSARTAALAAGHIGGNAEKAAYIQIDADSALDDLIGVWANSEQSTPVRRRPFRR